MDKTFWFQSRTISKKTTCLNNIQHSKKCFDKCFDNKDEHKPLMASFSQTILRAWLDKIKLKVYFMVSFRRLGILNFEGESVQ